MTPYLAQSHSSHEQFRLNTIQLLLIRLNCKFDEELTTDNILHYLGILEERALEIISNYLQTKEFSNGDQANSSNGSNMPSEKSTGGRVAMGTAAPISVNAPRLLDYSSDDSGDEGGESWMKPIHRSDMNYSKIASIVPKRKTIPGRRGSIFGLQPRRRTNISAASDGVM